MNQTTTPTNRTTFEAQAFDFARSQVESGNWTQTEANDWTRRVMEWSAQHSQDAEVDEEPEVDLFAEHVAEEEAEDAIPAPDIFIEFISGKQFEARGITPSGMSYMRQVTNGRNDSKIYFVTHLVNFVLEAEKASMVVDMPEV